MTVRAVESEEGGGEGGEGVESDEKGAVESALVNQNSMMSSAQVVVSLLLISS